MRIKVKSLEECLKIDSTLNGISEQIFAEEVEGKEEINIYVNDEWVIPQSFTNIESLQLQNKIMREALEFYADIDSWTDNDLNGCGPSICGDSLDGKDYDLMIGEERFSKHITVGGKRAREALKKIEEIG